MHLVHGGHGDMRGVGDRFRRNRSDSDNFGGEREHRVVDFQQGKIGQNFESAPGRIGVAAAGLIQDKL